MRKLINFSVIVPFILFTLLACGSNRSADTNEFYSFNDSDTIYETAEEGNTSKWLESDGLEIQNVEEGSNGSSRSILVKENWLRDENGDLKKSENGNLTNLAHYELPMNNEKQFILEFDKMRKIGGNDISYCFTVGVKLDTEYGERLISFNTFFDLAKMDSMEQWLVEDMVKEMVFPLSMNYVNEVNTWKRLRFDLEASLHEFEPDNKINKVISFYFQGGDDYLDNIRLVSE